MLFLPINLLLKSSSNKMVFPKEWKELTDIVTTVWLPMSLNVKKVYCYKTIVLNSKIYYHVVQVGYLLFFFLNRSN